MGKKRVIEKEGQTIQGGAESQSQGTSKGKEMKEGMISVCSSYNNTLISLADRNGNVIFATSAGRLGFKGSKKSTPFAASKVAETVADMATTKGVERIWIKVKGIGPGRDSALRSLGTKGFEIQAIKDDTPVPHNGPRAPKARRV